MNETGLVDVSPAEAKSWMDQGTAVLIDVREPYEYGFERIPGALLFPLATFTPAALPSGGNQKIVLQCGTSKRSGIAAQRMIDAGHSVAYHIKGGLAAWKEAGLPLLGINPTTGAIEEKSA
ncbi:rhodanese-like domain-containing protein [Magnetospirillum molischianum]|uniref:Rhodanese-related sulfurtransferase n=1 Tax=Magnetospirillum molischianum DSM 120 TaxID=1150626 RepID=H8FPX5_MAGML|nr:rhodanese-like domain-containing protein [Magnetospirillum molischianum]CCG40413.1 Rhodanese-related sulfurtransferase [Magnetospirillum molischianum DSM 120]